MYSLAIRIDMGAAVITACNEDERSVVELNQITLAHIHIYGRHTLFLLK
jgi:hypothetical protein